MNRTSVAEVEPRTRRPRALDPCAHRGPGPSLAAGLVAALVCAASAGVVSQPSDSLSPLDAWRKVLPGIRTTESQFEAEESTPAPAEHRQRLLIRLLQPSQTMPGLHIYLERARLARLQRPVSQEVWRVSGVATRVKVERFLLRIPGRFLGARSSDGLLGRMGLEDLELMKGCDLAFDLRDGRWQGTTAGRSCRADAPGGYSLVRVTWDAERVTFDERQVAADGRETSGPPNGVAYEFTPERPLESTR